MREAGRRRPGAGGWGSATALAAVIACSAVCDGTETTASRPRSATAETSTAAEAGPRDAAPPAAASSFAPCPARAPEGMACIPGGTFTLGFAGGEPDEREPGEVQVDTFFMDLREVTNAELATCVAAKRCDRPMPYRGFSGPQQPVVASSWFTAAAYCEMAGKRLPTEAEWERAASGPDHTQYPWGPEPAGCARANVTDRRGHGCGAETTEPVGSRQPGHWGLHDMAGNVHEWVADWYSPCLRGCEGECGDDCFGRNPRGPCQGAAECPGRTKRSIRGGSWYWPEERARTTARRGAAPENVENHRFGFRCARDLEPGAVRERERETPEAGTVPSVPSVPSGPAALLSEPTRRVLAALPGEPLATPDEHYFHTNEWRHDLLAPRLRGLGGAYVGVGADQNYTMAYLAGAELILLVDFDPRIPRLHRIYEVLVPASATGDDLVERFGDASADATEAMLRGALGADAEAEAIVEQFRTYRRPWRDYLGRVRRWAIDHAPFGWLGDPAAYAWVQRMFREGRVVARAGDVTGETTLRGMGAALRELGIPAQVVYFSNAEQFFTYAPSFVANIRSLPASPRSIVVRTTRHPRLTNAEADSWHYVVQDLTDFRERLETGAYPRSVSMIADLLSAGHRFVGRDGLSVIDRTIPRREAERAREAAARDR